MGVKEDYFDVLFRIGKERVVRHCEISELERRGMDYWIGFGMVFKQMRKNPEQPTEDEFHYTLTEKGHEYYLSCGPDFFARFKSSPQA
jgi:hypothetical protein